MCFPRTAIPDKVRTNKKNYSAQVTTVDPSAAAFLWWKLCKVERRRYRNSAVLVKTWLLWEDFSLQHYSMQNRFQSHSLGGNWKHHNCSHLFKSSGLKGCSGWGCCACWHCSLDLSLVNHLICITYKYLKTNQIIFNYLFSTEGIVGEI